jgi:hypothetical protein
MKSFKEFIFEKEGDENLELSVKLRKLENDLKMCDDKDERIKLEKEIESIKSQMI